ncbi:PREDICTED: disease resistance protein At4g27190-like [Fragaria vesca subsp. vesca]
MSTGDLEAYEATRKSMGEIMKKLKDDNVTALAVYGMGGVGKTTLVKHVAAQSCKNGIFHHVVMAVVSQSPNVERIQHTLLEELVGFENLTESGRASRLYKEIMRKHNILILLDDIWGFIDLSRIGIPSYDLLKKCNSKVLITTRKLHVCNSMHSQASILLNILSEQDSWSMFVKKTKRSFESTTFEGVARKVAGECRGLPIALIAVARALGDKDLAEWQTAAQQLKKSQMANPDHDDTAFECLKLSYDYLKHEDYKSCFLLCCLFPEDYDIPIEDLFKYAIGKGLFRDTDTIYEARAIADTVVKHLIDSSLLLDGKYDGHVRMHDVVRDTAMRIAKCEDGHGFLVRAGCGLKDWSCRSHEDYYAISLMGNELHSLPEELIGSKLKILLLQGNRYLNEIPETFSQSRNELRVLDLSRTNISLLPQSFSLLTKLQALHLDFCLKAVDISIIGKLKKLEILSMRQYPLTELSREIGNLTNLRMLDIDGWSSEGGGIVTIPSEVISKLHRIEELYMMNCGFVNWESPIEGEGDEINIGFGELAGLSKLKILQVFLPNAEYIPKNVEVEPGWFYFDIHIGCTSGLDYQFDRKSRSLLLRKITISTLPDWFIKAVTEKTEKLEYDCCGGMSDIVMEYDHGRLHKLKHLTVAGHRLHSYVYLKELMNTIRRVETRPVFENLEELHLIDLIHLEELCVETTKSGETISELDEGNGTCVWMRRV